jgi:hypothetical protein
MAGFRKGPCKGRKDFRRKCAKRNQKMKNRLLVPFLLLAAALMFNAGCMKKENYPDTPEISYIGLELYYDTASIVRTGVLAISYTDGNGDIGLNTWDTFPPFQRGGPYYYNYVIDYFEKQNGIFKKVDLLIPFSLRIPVLSPDDPGRAIKGVIYDTLGLYPPPLHDTIRFEAYIYDRGLHKSNVITTPEIILKR